MDPAKHEQVYPASTRSPDVSRARPIVPLVIGAGVLAVLVLGAALVWHAEAKTNKVALAASPKPVTVIAAQAAQFLPVHTYVGTLRPWVEAKVGPQFISAYVDAVLVRPGAVVKKGQVLATLDCRNATAATAALASQAQAIGARQQAIAHEAARTTALLDGGFVSPNEAEQKMAQSHAESAELSAQEANLTKSALDVSDCVLRAPFDGEVSLRLVDPGGYARPGMGMIGLVDRSTVRMTADAPEGDFDAVAPGAKVTVHLVSTNRDLPATISRRAPSADPGTRTVHFEIDLDDADRSIPVDTTGEVRVPQGTAVPASSVPLLAVSINDEKATLFSVGAGVARAQTFPLLGEQGANVYFDPKLLAPGTDVVTEGRALLRDHDPVTMKVETAEPTGAASSVLRDPKDERKAP